jgi:glycosyltransferase involved in cell wall biosynthesis
MTKVAVVHEWLTSFAGSERVVEQLLLMYPEADLFVAVDDLPAAERSWLGGRQPITGPLQRLPGPLRRRFRGLLPLMPFLIEQVDLSSYDLVLSSSHAVAKGVLCGPDQVHVSYCHSPMRYAWDLQHQYLRESGLGFGPRGLLARASLHYLRHWDQRSAQGPDTIVANSNYVARRIRRCWGRESTVVHPPVAVDAFPLCEGKDDYFLAASRLVPYKQMPLIAEAFAGMPNRRLVIVGDGPDRPRLEALARSHSNLDYRGWLPTPELRILMQRARALVFAAEEDFGILPVETMASGTPVIAFGRGGVVDSVEDSLTGIWFQHQTVSSIQEAVRRFDHATLLDAAGIRARAERFAPDRFRRRMAEVIADAVGRLPSVLP